MKAMKAIALILIIATISCSAMEKGIILEKFMDNPKELFKAYYVLFDKKTSYDINSPEGLNRFEVFKTNVEWIKRENAKEGKQVYGITPFTDLTPGELKLNHLKGNEQLEEALKINFTNLKQTTDSSKPFSRDVPEIDWRQKMNPVKQYTYCRASSAFASIATVEGNYNISFGTLFDLSEQYIISCDVMNSGCTHGWPAYTSVFIAENGVLQTKDFPYLDSKGKCDDGKKANALNIVSSFEYCIDCTADEWYALLKQGPITVVVDSYHGNLRNYKPTSLDTPWTPTSCESPDVAVTAVGVKVVNGKTLLILRNSWGKNWGFEGHFSIDASNPCFIMNYGWRAVTQQHKPFPAPTCPTFFSSCSSADAKSSSNCYGIANATLELGTTIKGWDAISNNKNWQFFQNENCTGLVDLKYGTQSCFAQYNSPNGISEYNSAASLSLEPALGCVALYSGPCATGKRYDICSNIYNLDDYVGIRSIKSVIFNSKENYSGNVVSLVLFDRINIDGNGVSLTEGKYFNIDDQPSFSSFLPKAKSLGLQIYPNNVY